jgi:glycyl-tRNA synthetase beta chain
MVREFTELQGTMGGIYAREEGLPEEVWKAIYFHYLPVAVEADTPPSAAQLGHAAPAWAAVSLADKLDTIVGLFAAGERPTGSRDPFGLRRAAQGVIRILVDLPVLTGVTRPVAAGSLVEQAFANYGGAIKTEGDAWKVQLFDFLAERQQHVLERRGHRFDEIRAVMPSAASDLKPYDVLRRAAALAQARKAPEFEALAALFKRVKNITRDFRPGAPADGSFERLKAALKEPAELALLGELEQRWPKIQQALDREQFLEAMNELAPLHAPVDRFFVDVLVMTDDPALREARLTLLKRLKDTVLMTGGDISEIAAEETRPA